MWLWRAVLTVRCAAFTLPWLAHLFVADVLLSALLPCSAIAPDLAYNASSAIAASVWHGIQIIFTRINRAKIVVSGAEKLPSGESAIVVANHVEWADFYMIQELAIKCGMLGRCRWFAKQQLKWVPFLGWGLWAMGFPLVSRRWTDDQCEMDRVFHGVLRRQWPTWLISYSEGTRYTDLKRSEAEKWCHANDKTLADHLLFPRTKGFVASVQKLRKASHMKAVYDVTIAYGKGDTFQTSPPSFLQTLHQPRIDQAWQFYVHVDRFEMGQLPQADDELARWLEQRWIEKGRRLEGLRQRMIEGLPWDREH